MTLSEVFWAFVAILLNFVVYLGIPAGICVVLFYWLMRAYRHYATRPKP